MKTKTLRSLPTWAALAALSLAVAMPAFTLPQPAHAQAGIAMRDGMPSLAPIIEKVTPAVVNVEVRSKVDMASNPLLNDPLFRRFFDDPDNQQQQQRPRQRERMSAGSGVIIDAKKGYIITNHHVVDEATEVTVTLKNKRQLTAKVLGSDEGTDVALLQVDAKDLKDLPMGDSNSLQVGDYVIAVGNPFGLGQTVTSGIVSALGRSGLNIEGFEDFIQTDASINPGNSGGALINLKGELVGMNTAIIGPSGGNVGIGFAVPSAMVKSVIAQLVEFGEVKRGRIGVEIADLTPEIAKNLGVDEAEGALVRSVIKNMPAETAGVKVGDVVTALDGKSVHGSQDLRNRLGFMSIGSSPTLTVIRNGKKQDIKVAIAKIPEETPVVAKADEERPALEGATFSTAPASARVKGVVVSEVERGSPAANVGLKADDIIVAVNRKPVASVDDFNKAMKDGGRQVALFIKREGQDQLLLVP